MTESTVDQVAKVINPYAFDEWQRHFVYAVGKGDTEEVAREFADWAGAGALATARRIAGPIAAEIDRLTAEVERLDAALREARDALMPIAQRCDDTHPNAADSSGITVRIVHLRRARDAYFAIDEVLRDGAG
jgi:hypothetical protein